MSEFLVRIIADGGVVVIVLIAIVALWKGVDNREKLQKYSYALMAGLTSLLIAKLGSLVYQPAVVRPFVELGSEPGAAYLDNPGFPSDHALFVTVITLAVLALTSYTKITLVLAVLTVAVSLARVAALVHTPIDVVGGIIFGVMGGVWYLVMKSNTYAGRKHK